MSAAVGRTSISMSGAGFVVDPMSTTLNSGRIIDWDAVDDSYREGAQAIVVSGTAAQSATAVPVNAIPVALPVGAVLHFGAGKFAKLTAKADVGATSLAVVALPTALAANDTALYWRPGAVKVLKAGTPVGDSLTDKKIGPRVASTNPAIGLLVADHRSDSKTDSLSGVGVYVGGNFYENLIPGATGSPPTLASGIKTELGARFYFEQFSDSRAS